MEGRRIGFTLQSIHTGSSLDLWSSLARHVEKEDKLFIFPLGRLSSPDERMRAGVMNLVNNKNLDGLIAWASSLGGFVSEREVATFHEENFSSLPFVTIGLKCEGHAEVSFDAYDGFKGGIEHLIKDHGAKRLAFIRGPENHPSANDRYNAYLDGLKENFLELDDALISSPFGWSDGLSAIKELCEERSLKPGIDFDALCFASDLMMFAAGRYLEKKGVRIPKDVKLLGFNNSEESQLLRVPCTTVSMPYERVGLMAYTLLKGMLNYPDEFECPDVMLPAKLVIRRSCGCSDSLGGKEKAEALIKNRQSYAEWASRAFSFTDDEQALFDSLLSRSFAFPLLDDEIEQFLMDSASLFEMLLRRSVDPSLIYEALSWIRLINEDKDFESLLNTRLIQLVGTSFGRVKLLKDFERRDQDKILNSLKCDLLSLKSFKSLAESLYKYLPSLSVTAAFVVLKTENLKSRFAGGFDENNIYLEEMEFEEDLILPSAISSKLKSGVYIVNSLYSENTDLGYLVTKVEKFDGPLIEELRTSISSAVLGTYLLETSNKAREVAERAERMRNEFFSNVSEDLRDPLLNIKRLLFSNDEDKNLKIARELEKANHMLDLSLAKTGELDLESKLVNLETECRSLAEEEGVAFSSDSDIPLVYFDPERLKEALSLIIGISRENGADVSLSLKMEEAPKILLENTENGIDYRLYESDTSFLLAERIMVMHHGLLKPELSKIEFAFSLPTFSLESPRMGMPLALYFGKKRSLGYPGEIDSVTFLKKGEIGQLGAIVWDVDQSNYDSLSMLRSLSRRPGLERVPLYIYASKGCSFTPLALIDHLIKDYDAPPVLVYGKLPDELRTVLSEKNIVLVNSLEKFEAGEREKSAKLLLITNEVKAEDIIAFRRSSGSTMNIIVMLKSFSSHYAESLGTLNRVLLVNTCIAESEDFVQRFNSLLSGSEILPAFTGAIVKKALGYLVEHATSQITRWQLAESVNVSEDYLTRIFRKEIGLSPWDYLNRYRIYIASELLKQEAMSVNEVAYRTGFQDQAYFCRVFKKIKGLTPGKMRTRS